MSAESLSEEDGYPGLPAGAVHNQVHIDFWYVGDQAEMGTKVSVLVEAFWAWLAAEGALDLFAAYGPLPSLAEPEEQQ